MEGIQYYGMQQEFAETIQEWERDIKDGSQEGEIKQVEEEGRETDKVIPINRNRMLWWGSAVAAAVALLIAFLTFSPKTTPSRLANAYIEDNLSTLSTTMSAETDRLAEGINAFNRKDFAAAEEIFLSLSDNVELAPETAKYLGITYLHTGDYEGAIEQFHKLISFTNLYANPGKFYLAITLMKRSAGGDEERARKLLEEVVEQKLPGNKEASDWLTRMD
jgi:tetratricopeptide (TPR) repeat protein